MKHLKWDFNTVNWIAESEEIYYVYSTDILQNTAKITEVNSTEIDSFLLKTERDRIMCHYSADLQTGKQTLVTSKNSI